MSKRRRHGHGRTAAEAQSKGRTQAAAGAGGLLTALIALAAAGIALTAYLSFVHASAAQAAFCAAGSGCDIVQSSRFSSLLGMPLATWGLLTYAGILGFAVAGLKRRRQLWRVLWLTLIGAGISVYLQGVSVLAIGALCPWCLVSAALMLTLAVLAAVLTARIDRRRLLTGALPMGLTSALVLTGFLHLHWAGVFDPAAGPEDPYLRALATHLADSGARFYGAYWCPHCQEQKEIFGASAKRLPYVECSPAGPKGPRASACVEADIRSYPSWIVQGSKLDGVLSPRVLARQSGFRAPPGT